MRPSPVETDQLERKNFYLSTRLIKKAEKVASEKKWNFSELVRFAIEEFIKAFEEEKKKRELEIACRNYYEFNKQFSKEWAKFETTRQQ